MVGSIYADRRLSSLTGHGDHGWGPNNAADPRVHAPREHPSHSHPILSLQAMLRVPVMEIVHSGQQPSAR